MRRTISAVALASLCACSMQFGGSQPQVAGTPPPPVAKSTVASTLTQLSPNALSALPTELAFSLHYRRSDTSHVALAPARAFVAEVLRDAKVSASDTNDVERVMDALASIDRLDMFVAAPTTKLTRVDDLEQLVETGCVTARWSMDKGGEAATLLASPPAGFEQQIAPLTYKVTDSTFAVWSPGCAKMPAFADTDAVAKTGDAIAGTSATFVQTFQPGHALLHDEVLWKELTAKYRKVVSEALASSGNEEMAQKYLTRAENFVSHLNLWKVMKESNAMVSSWSFLANGSWNMEMVYSADSPASAEIMRRTTVGSLDSQILFLSDTASQEVQSVSDGSTMAVSVTFKNPDLSTLLVASGGASFISAFASAAGAATARQGGQVISEDTDMWEDTVIPDAPVGLPGDTLDDEGTATDEVPVPPRAPLIPVPKTMTVPAVPSVPAN